MKTAKIKSESKTATKKKPQNSNQTQGIQHCLSENTETMKTKPTKRNANTVLVLENMQTCSSKKMTM